jgi:hypothetical protein
MKLQSTKAVKLEKNEMRIFSKAFSMSLDEQAQDNAAAAMN